MKQIEWTHELKLKFLVGDTVFSRYRDRISDTYPVSKEDYNDDQNMIIIVNMRWHRDIFVLYMYKHIEDFLYLFSSFIYSERRAGNLEKHMNLKGTNNEL